MMMTHDQALIKWEMSSLLKFTWGQEIQGSTMKDRFSDAPSVPVGMDSVKFSALTGRGSVREFTSKPVDDDIIEFLCGVAFSAPTKSDLQQRDIVVVRDPVLLEGLKACCAVQKWIDNISLMLVFCGNHRRQRRVSEMHGLPFVNDHLDAFFNASVDAALALAYFVAAAETAGLGCCPISAIRNQPGRASELLNLPDLVFPVAGLALGWPAEKPQVSQRLPLAVTVHRDRFDDSGEAEAIAAYDNERIARQPFAAQRESERFGASENYVWSEDKARQYASRERESFGAFIRTQGFDLR